MSIFSRLFPGNHALAEYEAVAAAPETIFCEPRVSMTGRANHLHAPNRYASKAITRHNGAIALSRSGLVVIVGRRLRCHATFSDSTATPLGISVGPGGMTLDVDVAAAFPPKGQGSLTLEIRTAIPQEVLLQLPGRELRATVPETDLLTMTRWI